MTKTWVVLSVLALFFALPAGAADPVDCSKITSMDDKDTFKQQPADVKSCIERGYDAPKGWRPDEGKSKGSRGVGAKGFNYGTVSAPESPPGARGANASVSREAIDRACNFPPRLRVSITPPYVSFPKGSCLDFMNNLLKDKDGLARNSPAPTGVNGADICPIETDMTGMYGNKKPLTKSQNIPATCGGMVPTTTNDLTLNRNPTGMAVTNGNSRIWFYKKSGNTFVKKGDDIALPYYLCKEESDGWGGTERVKDMDLTASLPQTITYNAGDQGIAIRLQSRATMPPQFQPPYNSSESEKYLILYLNTNPSDPNYGNPIIPDQSDCPLTVDHFREPAVPQDILVQPQVVKGCKVPTLPAKITQKKIMTCPVGYHDGPVAGDKKCYDSTNTAVKVKRVATWVELCANGKPAPAGGCPEGTELAKIACADGTTANYADASCDITEITPEDPACFDPAAGLMYTQYSVLNRPSLYYPPKSTAKIYKVDAATYAMAETVDNTRFFTQASTVILLKKSAPPITFNEGGTLKLRDKSLISMNQGAVFKPATAEITMPFGGDHISAGGTQLASFADGATYIVPDALKPYTYSSKSPIYEVKVIRSLTLPKGFIIPTMPTISGRPPYFREPVKEPAK